MPIMVDPISPYLFRYSEVAEVAGLAEQSVRAGVGKGRFRATLRGRMETREVARIRSEMIARGRPVPPLPPELVDIFAKLEARIKPKRPRKG